jgi:hypothetical protein
MLLFCNSFDSRLAVNPVFAGFGLADKYHKIASPQTLILTERKKI